MIRIGGIEQAIRMQALVHVARHVSHGAVQPLSDPAAQVRGAAGQVGVGDSDLLETEFQGPATDVVREFVKVHQVARV